MGFKVIWSDTAIADLHDICTYIAHHDPQTAGRMKRIKGQVFYRKKSCNSDTKVRLRLPTGLRFYYPDAQVTCQPNPPTDSYQDQPIVVVEVISDATRRTDEGEKLDGYCALPSLEVYLLVESERPLVIGYRRASTGFAREVFSGLDAVIPLGCSGAVLPLAEIYERVIFSS